MLWRSTTSLHVSFSLYYLPICNKIILFHFMALFTHLTFYLIFQPLLIDGSNLTTSKQLTFLQNCTRDKPSVFHLFAMTSHHLLGCDVLSPPVCTIYPLLSFTMHLPPGIVYIHLSSQISVSSEYKLQGAETCISLLYPQNHRLAG